MSVVVFFLVTRLEAMPRSTFVICWFVLVGLLGGPRFAYRVLKDRGFRHVLERRRGGGIPVLLIGVSDSAHGFIREMARDPESPYEVIGLITETAGRLGREVAGVPVLGMIDELPAVVERLDGRGQRPQRLIITTPGPDGPTLRRLLDAADRLAIPLAPPPPLTQVTATPPPRHPPITPVPT